MKNRKLKATDYLFHICNYGVFAILTLLCAYPFYYLIINSVSANDLSANGAINLIPRGIHLRNYLEVFKLSGLPMTVQAVPMTVLATDTSAAMGSPLNLNTSR